MVENAVNPEELNVLLIAFAEWVKESHAQDAYYGEALEGRPRFDLQPGHSTAVPGLRRI
ncbi:MAG: hypothetical protein P8M25_10105 [Paracoccaceae bacterium]|nr:hypothetical protein [Paracoccaceae bacterium]